LQNFYCAAAGVLGHVDGFALARAFFTRAGRYGTYATLFRAPQRNVIHLTLEGSLLDIQFVADIVSN
jgi:hypothetical protein